MILKRTGIKEKQVVLKITNWYLAGNDEELWIMTMRRTESWHLDDKVENGVKILWGDCSKSNCHVANHN